MNQIELVKKLANINLVYVAIIVFINLLSYFSFKSLDLILIGLSVIVMFVSSLPYFREFNIENFKLTFFLQGLGLVAICIFLTFKNPLYIFLLGLNATYIFSLSIFKDGYKYAIPLLILSIIPIFYFLFDAKYIIQLSKIYSSIQSFRGGYLNFLLVFVFIISIGLYVVTQLRSFIMDYYKSQVMSNIQARMDEINRVAQQKAREAEEKHREIILVKEKQEKIFAINTDLAKRVKNIKAQLQYISSELKDMLYATGVVVLFERGGFITADYHVDVPLPVVDTLKVSPKTNEIVKNFIFKCLKNKEIMHINKRKEIFVKDFSKEECITFLQSLSKLTFDVYEILMVPIINSFGESMGVFVIFNSRQDYFTDIDKRLAELLGVQAGILIHNSMLIKKIEDTFYETINAFSSAIEAKDKYTPVLHTYRVGELAYKVALEMGLSEEEAERIKIAGILHDVGKLAIPDSILAKQGPLTEEEREIIKTHSEEGSKILSKISFFREKNIHIYVLYHHERVDGRGYPKGLRGREIPLASNIISVADTYDAISTPRPYNKHYASEQKAIEIIKAERGRQFFEEVVDAFFRVLEKEKAKKKVGNV
ncbi:MAG: HD domain-containing phosphohydrolase [bacterium]